MQARITVDELLNLCASNKSLEIVASELLHALEAVLPYTQGWSQQDVAGRPWLVQAQAVQVRAKQALRFDTLKSSVS